MVAVDYTSLFLFVRDKASNGLHLNFLKNCNWNVHLLILFMGSSAEGIGSPVLLELVLSRIVERVEVNMRFDEHL